MHEKDISNRSIRHRMELHRTPHARSQRHRTPSSIPLTRDPRRRLLRPRKRLPVAPASPRLSQVANRLAHYFRKWRIEGTWERINRALRERLRVRLGRDPQPSAGVVDSQSLKSTGVGGEERGFDGGKKVKGRKRHLLVVTDGFVLQAKVHSAKVMDYEGIKTLLHRAKERFPRLSHLWLDASYRGRTRARTGSKRRWVGAWIWWSVRRSQPPRGVDGVGQGVGQGGRKGGLAETDAP